jgi:hypothetical protein
MDDWLYLRGEISDKGNNFNETIKHQKQGTIALSYIPFIELLLLRQHKPLPFWGRHMIAEFFGCINP